jgi:APA family basic amino acid/polyamine antiporter
MSDIPRELPDAGAQLKRDLGLHHVTASGVAIIIGAGIFVLLAPATKLAGSQVWLSFIVAAFLCMFTALSYAELAALFPKSGGEFEFAKVAFPPWLTFLTFWLNVSSLIIAAATVALGFAGYLQKFVDVDPRVGAAGLVCLATSMAMIGVKWSGRLVIITALIQSGALLLVIVFGLTQPSAQSLTQGHGTTGILAAAALVFFAYIGFDEVTTLSEETINPTKNIPRALILALAISTVLYVLVSIAAVRLIGADALAVSQQPMADVMGNLWQQKGATLLAVVALFTTFDTTLLAIQSSARVLFGWSRDAADSPTLQKINRRGIPWLAVLIVAAVALFMTMLGDLTLIAGLTDFAVFLVFIVVNSALIRLRFTHPDLPRPFKVAGNIGRVPVLAVGGLLMTLVMLPRLSTQTLQLGGVLVGIGLLAYFAIPSLSKGLHKKDVIN